MTSTVWSTSNNGKLIYISPKQEHLDGCVEVIREAFFTDENVSKAVEVSKYPAAMKELEELTLRAINDGVSIIAVEKETRKIVAGAFNKIQVPGRPGEGNYFENFAEKCKQPSSKALVRFMIEADAECDLFEHCKIDCLLEVMFIATLAQFRGLGIGKKLFELSIEIAKKLKSGENVKQSPTGESLSLEPTPQAVACICTSFITKKIVDSLQFLTAAEISFDRWSFNGKSFSETTGPETPKTSTVYLKI